VLGPPAFRIPARGTDPFTTVRPFSPWQAANGGTGATREPTLESHAMPLLLWLLGVPGIIVILLWITGVIGF
jgi:hypothetical protein